MIEINCPFCSETIISDVVDTLDDVNGQWQCENGHMFLLKYVGDITESITPEKTIAEIKREFIEISGELLSFLKKHHEISTHILEGVKVIKKFFENGILKIEYEGNLCVENIYIIANIESLNGAYKKENQVIDEWWLKLPIDVMKRVTFIYQ
jgi:hypothetical protein